MEKKHKNTKQIMETSYVFIKNISHLQIGIVLNEINKRKFEWKKFH